MNNSLTIMEVFERDHNSPDPKVKKNYTEGAFIHTITCIADCVAGSKSTFVSDPTSFLSGGGVPCHPFPDRCNKRSGNPCQL